MGTDTFIGHNPHIATPLQDMVWSAKIEEQGSKIFGLTFAVGALRWFEINLSRGKLFSTVNRGTRLSNCVDALLAYAI